MGHWILEVSKFAVYVGLPLTSFTVFNSPDFYIPALYEYRKATKQFSSEDENIRKSNEEFDRLRKSQPEEINRRRDELIRNIMEVKAQLAAEKEAARKLH